jgi:hypothetical protein
MTNFSDLLFEIIPGANAGSVLVYEDDGDTVDYVSNIGVGYIKMSYVRHSTTAGSRMHIVLETIGNISNITRHITIRIPDSAPMASWSFGTHHYDGNTLTAEISFDWEGWRRKEVELVTSLPHLDLSGIRAGINHARLVKAALDEVVLTPGTHPCWHEAPCGYRSGEDNLIQAASIGAKLDAAAGKKNMFESVIFDFIRYYNQSRQWEITVENVLRVDTVWAPTQGGWPEATRWRVNYAVNMIKSAMENVCLENSAFIMPLLCPVLGGQLDSVPQQTNNHPYKARNEPIERIHIPENTFIILGH